MYADHCPMTESGPASSYQGHGRASGSKTWRHRILRRTDEMAAAIDAILADMAGADYSVGDRFAVRLALQEALVNALVHGNRRDSTKQVRIRYDLSDERLLVEVEDEGAGFNPGAVPDPLASENLDRPGGRGLMMMRASMTWVRHNERGNRVTMCRERTA